MILTCNWFFEVINYSQSDDDIPVFNDHTACCPFYILQLTSNNLWNCLLCIILCRKDGLASGLVWLHLIKYLHITPQERKFCFIIITMKKRCKFILLMSKKRQAYRCINDIVIYSPNYILRLENILIEFFLVMHYF